MEEVSARRVEARMRRLEMLRRKQEKEEARVRVQTSILKGSLGPLLNNRTLTFFLPHFYFSSEMGETDRISYFYLSVDRACLPMLFEPADTRS